MKWEDLQVMQIVQITGEDINNNEKQPIIIKKGLWGGGKNLRFMNFSSGGGGKFHKKLEANSLW